MGWCEKIIHEFRYQAVARDHFFVNRELGRIDNQRRRGRLGDLLSSRLHATLGLHQLQSMSSIGTEFKAIE